MSYSDFSELPLQLILIKKSTENYTWQRGEWVNKFFYVIQQKVKIIKQ